MSALPAPTLVVVGAADGAYAMPLAVMLRSLTARLAPPWHVEAHIFDDGLAPRERAAVEASLDARCTLRWATARGCELAAQPLWGRMPRTTYQKLTLGSWLPAEIPRAIWLDCDLLVRTDLARLWQERLGEHLALAARDPLVPRLGSRFGVAAHRELGLARDAKYFNAGVLLIDLERWRAERVEERAADYLARYGRRLTFWDQEALNAVLAGRWGELDPRWNRNPNLHLLFPAVPAATENAADDAWIAHFSGRLKPWTCPGASPYQSEFEAHLDATAWAGWQSPRTWRSALLARYAGSPLRRILFPLEQAWTAALRDLTRRPGG